MTSEEVDDNTTAEITTMFYMANGTHAILESQQNSHLTQESNDGDSIPGTDEQDR